MSRTKNSIYNALMSVALQLVNIVTAFILRKILVSMLGIDNVGLISTISGVITVLSLAELGIASAFTYSLYKPLSEENYEIVKSIMTVFKKVYFLIALIILVLGVACIPFLHTIIGESSFSSRYINIVYILFVIQAASSYLFSYNRTLIVADQKAYLVSRIDAIFKVVSFAGAAIVLLIFKNLIIYVFWLILIGLINNYVVFAKVNNHYSILKNYEARPLSKEFRIKLVKDVKDLFLNKLSGTVSNSADTLLTTYFSNLSTAGSYSNYQSVITQIKTVIVSVFEACSASMGNLLTSKEVDRSKAVLNQLLFLAFGSGLFCSLCLYNMLDPFVSIWLGNEYLIDHIFLFILVIVFFQFVIREPILITVAGTGLFKYDKYVAFSVLIVNVISSVAFGFLLGIRGVFIGTVLSQLVCIIGKAIIYFRIFLKEKPFKFMLRYCGYLLYTLALLLISNRTCAVLSVQSYLGQLLINFLISAGFTVVALLPFIRTEEFKNSVVLIRRFVKKYAKK